MLHRASLFVVEGGLFYLVLFARTVLGDNFLVEMKCVDMKGIAFHFCSSRE